MTVVSQFQVNHYWLPKINHPYDHRQTALNFLHFNNLNNSFYSSSTKLMKALPKKVDLIFFTGNMGDFNFFDFSDVLRQKYPQQPFVAIPSQDSDLANLQLWQKQRFGQILLNNSFFTLDLPNGLLNLIGLRNNDQVSLLFLVANQSPSIILLPAPPTQDFLLAVSAGNVPLIICNNQGSDHDCTQLETGCYAYPFGTRVIASHGLCPSSPRQTKLQFDYVQCQNDFDDFMEC